MILQVPEGLRTKLGTSNLRSDPPDPADVQEMSAGLTDLLHASLLFPAMTLQPPLQSVGHWMQDQPTPMISEETPD